MDDLLTTQKLIDLLECSEHFALSIMQDERSNSFKYKSKHYLFLSDLRAFFEKVKKDYLSDENADLTF